MRAIALLMGMFLLIQGMEGIAQNPEKFALWPQGPREKNGLEGKETMDKNGKVANCSTAELTVYCPPAEKNTGMAVVICPGGGYSHLAMNHEGVLFAEWLNERGITAIVLKYRMPNHHDGVPLADAARAVRWVRSRAEEWNINPQRVGIAGFSAGGHLASTLATHHEPGKSQPADRLEAYSSRPDFVLLFYPVISMKDGLTHAGSKNNLLGKDPAPGKIQKYSNELQVNANTPPAFLVHSDDDAAVPSMNSVLFYQALKKNKVPAVLYIFPKGGHGWGLRPAFEYYPLWTSLLEKWLKTL